MCHVVMGKHKYRQKEVLCMSVFTVIICHSSSRVPSFQQESSAIPEPLRDAAALKDNCCYGVTVPRKYDAAFDYFFFFQPKTHFFSLTGQHQLQKQKSSVYWNSLKAPDNSYKRDAIVPHPPKKPCIGILHRIFLK